jgi:DNA-binding CsgD family transcriptional regulator
VLLGDADLAAVLAVLDDVADCADLAEFRVAVLRRLREVVPCDSAGYNEVRVADGSHDVVLEPADYYEVDPTVEFERHMHEHPVLRAHQSGEVGAAAISDFLTVAEYHRLAIYRDVYGPLGIEDQLAFTIDVSDGTVTGIVMNRSTRGFSDREKALLDAMTPNLAHARRAAIARERAVTDLAHAVDSVAGMQIGVVNIDGERRARTWSGQVQRLMWHYFDASFGEEGALPPPLERWVSGGAGEPLTSERDGRALSVRFVRSPAGAGGMLLFHEPAGSSLPAFQDLGLSPREAEVLACVVEGLSDEDIGRRLEISPRTAQKHLQRVYAQLGVHNRTAAVAAALGR